MLGRGNRVWRRRSEFIAIAVPAPLRGLSKDGDFFS
jgi:hypothetical protein